MKDKMEILFTYRGEERTIPLADEAIAETIKNGFKTYDGLVWYVVDDVNKDVVNYIMESIKDKQYYLQGCPLEKIKIFENKIVKHIIFSSIPDDDREKYIEEVLNKIYEKELSKE